MGHVLIWVPPLKNTKRDTATSMIHILINAICADFSMCCWEAHITSTRLLIFYITIKVIQSKHVVLNIKKRLNLFQKDIKIKL